MLLRLFFVFELVIHLVSSQNAEESPTGALLSFPYVLESHPLYGLKWEVAPSQFGFHDYGGKLEGILVLPKNITYHTECNAEPYDTNDYIHWVNDWNVEADNNGIIMLVDRGDCYFVEKMENAQTYGVDGAIVLDYRVENLFTMWPPEDFEDDITIPSVLLDEVHGETLMAALGVKNWSPRNIEQTTYPSTDTMNWTIARLEWGLPHEDDRVEYSLWTSANDPDSVLFKQNFKWTAIDLDHRNKTVFTPHFYLLNGSHWNCDSGSYRCGRQCTNGGRYCSVDPEYDLSIGLDGMDVVQENLRQICLWDFTSQDENNDTIWWDYSILWDINCFETGGDVEATFTAECSYQQMDYIDPSGTLKTAVQACIDTSGGYAYKGGVNTLLEAETRYREELGIYALPTVTVNEFMIHGNIDCNEVTVEHCQVLDAICAGYVNGTQPPECFYTPAPTPMTCDDAYKDCAGICFGNAEIDCADQCDGGHETDYCGQCLQPNSPDWNNCVGCDGVPYSGTVLDCDNVCGGPHQLNNCSYCLNPNRTDFNTYGRDCAGTCGGTSELDACGECKKTSDPTFDNCIGCDNVPYSNKTLDCREICGGTYETNECGICMDPNEDDFDTRGVDCRGECGNQFEYDMCGNCKYLSDPTFNDCIGCDGVIDSGKTYDCSMTCGGTKELNPCGYCLYPDTDQFETYGQDCRKVCNGGYEWNMCGKCVLPSNITENCSGTTDNSGNNSTNLSHDLVAIVAVVAGIVIVLVCCVLLYLWRRQKQADERFGNIIKQYEMMDDNDNIINSGGVRNPKRVKTSKKKMVSIPNDEEDVEEDDGL